MVITVDQQMNLHNYRIQVSEGKILTAFTFSG